MPVMGFDDERVRDGWVEEEMRRAVWVGLPAVGPTEAALAAVREAVVGFLEEVLEVMRPVLEAIAVLGEAAIEAVVGLWELMRGEEGARPAGVRPPRHDNCRCLPVERVDPVRAGRARWWTRK